MRHQILWGQIQATRLPLINWSLRKAGHLFFLQCPWHHWRVGKNPPQLLMSLGSDLVWWFSSFYQKCRFARLVYSIYCMRAVCFSIFSGHFSINDYYTRGIRWGKDKEILLNVSFLVTWMFSIYMFSVVFVLDSLFCVWYSGFNTVYSFFKISETVLIWSFYRNCKASETIIKKDNGEPTKGRR